MCLRCCWRSLLVGPKVPVLRSLPRPVVEAAVEEASLEKLLEGPTCALNVLGGRGLRGHKKPKALTPKRRFAAFLHRSEVFPPFRPRTHRHFPPPA